MTVSYFVFYQGTAEDRDDFVEYYRTTHAAILETFPGLLDLRIHQGMNWKDGQNIADGGFLLVAEMVFPDKKTLQAAIVSPERTVAREDFGNFSTFHGKILHQAMATIHHSNS